MYMNNVQCVFLDFWMIQCVFCTNKERQPAHHKHTDISTTTITCDRYMETRAWYLGWTMTKTFTPLACFLVNVHKRRLLFTEVNTETLKCCNHKSFECDDITFIQQHYVMYVQLYIQCKCSYHLLIHSHFISLNFWNALSVKLCKSKFIGIIRFTTIYP